MATYKIAIITYSEGKKFISMKHITNYSTAYVQDVKKVKKFLEQELKLKKW